MTSLKLARTTTIIPLLAWAIYAIVKNAPEFLTKLFIIVLYPASEIVLKSAISSSSLPSSIIPATITNLALWFTLGLLLEFVYSKIKRSKPEKLEEVTNSRALIKRY